MKKPTVCISWERKKCIGKGSFATVNLAVNKSTGQIFAAKSVQQTPNFSTQIQSLENEIQILKSLNSPFIISFISDDVTSSPTTSFRNLLLEYLPAGSVAGKPCSGENQLKSRAWCVASALCYIHSKGIVHCDVKGSNILITKNPNFVKLADFGSAGEVSGETPVMPRGSPMWMAPEVIRGECQGPESDVWSFGCTVIEMLTGKPCWDYAGAGVIRMIGYSDKVPEIPAELSETGRDFLEKCLRRDPDRRWSFDRLLKHPFLAEIAEQFSPRCVFDWVNDYFEDEFEQGSGRSHSFSPEIAEELSPRCVFDWVNEEFEDEFEQSFTAGELSIDGRIRKLSTERGPNWESGGWFAVRVPSGTHSEFCDLEGTSSGYLQFLEGDLGRVSWEYSNSGGREFQERARNCVGVSNDVRLMCWRGFERREIMIMAFYASCVHLIVVVLYCWERLMKQLILFTNYILYFFILVSF